MAITATNDSNEAKNLATSLGLTNFQIVKYVRTYRYQADAQWSFKNAFFYGYVNLSLAPESSGTFDGYVRFQNSGNIGNELINSVSDDVELLFPSSGYQLNESPFNNGTSKVVFDTFNFTQGTAGNTLKLGVFLDGYLIIYS